ncbi:unnamed protein product [Albugo candida]|nr:unnamed protein product [Albugo candida]|eukprot:CCI41464.1 unnamed protein product [Albugo candida]
MLQIIRVQARPEFPPVPAGFRLHKCSLSAPVQIETFIDPLVNRTYTSYDIMMKLAKEYKDQICVRFILFSHPDNAQSFEIYTSIYQVTKELGDDVFFKWLEIIYEHRMSFTDFKDLYLTPLDVRKKMRELASASFPRLSYKSLADENARLDGVERLLVYWKYAVSREIYDANIYLINGVSTSELPGVSYEWFKALIESVLQPIN